MNDLKTSDSAVAGQAGRISAADKAAAALKASGGTLTAQVTVTRAGTGKQEHYTLTVPVEQLLNEENQ